MEEQLEALLEEDTQRDMFMTFRTGEEHYGIPISYVEEIIGIQPITAVPEVEDYLRGLINLRGKIIPVIDVRVRFRQEALPYTDRTCIIVIAVKTMVVGLIVEEIDEVIKIAETDIVPPPSLNKNGFGNNKYVYGLAKAEGGVRLLLSPEKLIQDEDLEMLEQAVEESEDMGEE